MSTENKFKQYGVSGETAMLLDDRTFSISDCKEYVAQYGRYGDPEPIHTIEFAAVEQLKADIQELKTIIKEMSDHSKGYGHCGMDMFAHTKWRKFADDV